MNNGPECIPCCLRRVLRTADLVTSDEWLHRKILGEVMQDLARVDELTTPAEVVHGAARRTAKTLGVGDPYADEKRRWVDEIIGNADLVRGVIDESADPFVTALKFSLAANLIDCEFRDEIVRGFSLKTLLSEVEDLPFVADGIEDFRASVAQAPTVLFVHDTAGELFFDRLLIEKLDKPRDRVVSVVRESPILGDATREDAEAVGLDEVARIVDPGISCLGLPLTACSESFRQEYRGANLVVAKGQAAYQTLEGSNGQIEAEPKELYFLLRVKCPVMSRQLGVAVGDCVLEAG